jgi:hypothetical protein
MEGKREMGEEKQKVTKKFIAGRGENRAFSFSQYCGFSIEKRLIMYYNKNDYDLEVVSVSVRKRFSPR